MSSMDRRHFLALGGLAAVAAGKVAGAAGADNAAAGAAPPSARGNPPGSREPTGHMNLWVISKEHAASKSKRSPRHGRKLGMPLHSLAANCHRKLQ